MQSLDSILVGQAICETAIQLMFLFSSRLNFSSILSKDER